MTSRILAAVTVVALATSCASGGATPATSTTAPGIEEMVVFEARWLCEVQRRAFPSLAAMEAARAEELTASGVGAAEYRSFQARLAGDPVLRSRVSDGYDRICPSG